MANLKELRNKIGVVRSTRKVTAAMKLVAGVKLRRAEQKALASRAYAHELGKILSKLRREFLDINNELFSGREQINTEMIIVFASDRGLCGNFNYLINKKVFQIISDIQERNKKVHVVCVGTKLFEFFKRALHENDFIELAENFYKNGDLFNNSKKLAERAISDFISDRVDKVSIVYTRCYSAIRRIIETKQIIPVLCESNADKTTTIFEPNTDDVLKNILPYNIAIQIYQAALESVASEHSSRMTSMDNATRNADDLLSDLTISYNRKRQYSITQELVEVVSGADAIEKG